MKQVIIQQSSLKKAVKILIPFKGIRKKIRKKIQKENTSQVSKMNNDDRKMLKKFYKEDVKKLSELIGRNLNHWVQ
jgi:isochorismate hydrolase